MMVRRNGNFHERQRDHRSPEAIENDVRRTRHEMDETLDELGKRLEPGRLAQDVWQSFRHRMPGGPQAADAAKDFGASLGRRMSAHPVPVALIGAGLVWMLMEEGRKRQSGGGGMTSGISGKGHDLAERARSVADAARDSMGGAAHSTRDVMSHATERISSVGRRGMSSMQHAASTAQQKAHMASERAAGTFEEHPLAIAAVAMGIGMIAGIVTPNTRPENRAMGESAERMRRQAVKVADKKAADVIESATDSIASTAEETAESAKRAIGGRNEGDRAGADHGPTV